MITKKDLEEALLEIEGTKILSDGDNVLYFSKGGNRFHIVTFSAPNSSFINVKMTKVIKIPDEKTISPTIINNACNRVNLINGTPSTVIYIPQEEEDGIDHRIYFSNIYSDKLDNLKKTDSKEELKINIKIIILGMILDLYITSNDVMKMIYELKEERRAGKNGE